MRNNLLIVGSAECWQDDYNQFLSEHSIDDVDVCVLNYTLKEWTERVDVVATLHCDKMLPLLKEKVDTIVYRSGPMDHSKAHRLVHITRILGGSSGGLALTYGLQNYEHVYLVGVPLEGKNKYHGGSKYAYYHNFWMRDFGPYKEKVTSYSGWTKEFFGGV